MIFTEFRFLFFFLLVFSVHWSLRQDRARKVWLLICSYVFYAAWDWRFLALIVISTAVDFFAGIKIHEAEDKSRRRRWLTLSLVMNLGMLGVFKYLGFFVDSAAGLLSWMGFEASLPALKLVLPVGISFYTFQTMSYSLDIYFQRLKPTRDSLDLALFVGFFPQLVAGPIVRAKDFLPQLDTRRLFERVPVRACLWLFMVGFFKKAVVSDNIVALVDPYFADPANFSALGAVGALLMYAVQIYCDFSGYSDMAIACAGLLGYTLPVNFKSPYLAADIADFWRRWHISLSTWLRDYLYIPLGGSRGGPLKNYRNLLLTMLLGGLWHGASWTFVVWGGMHGMALAACRWWGARNLPSPGAFLGRILTFYWVCLAWIFFRAPDFQSAWITVRSVVLLESPGSQSSGMAPFAILAVLALLHLASARGWMDAVVERLGDRSFALVYSVATVFVLTFMNGAVQPFIYFQF